MRLVILMSQEAIDPEETRLTTPKAFYKKTKPAALRFISESLELNVPLSVISANINLVGSDSLITGCG